MVGATIEKKDDVVKFKDAESWLVWVHKKQEGALKQYYILPEYNYNEYRPDFLSSEDLKLMKRFFDDSRKLYGEHNVGCEEDLVQNYPKIDAEYQKMLKGYYTIYVPDMDDALLHHPMAGKYFHETVDKNGNAYMLSGKFNSPAEAKFTLNFIRDLGLSDQTRIVWVDINGIKEMTE